MTDLATLLEERSVLTGQHGLVLTSGQTLETKGMGYESRRLYSAAEQVKRALQSIESQIKEHEACSDADDESS